MTSRLPARARARARAVLLVVVALVLAPLAPAAAEGPGYGGTAAGLDVRWEPTVVPAGSSTPGSSSAPSSTAKPSSAPTSVTRTASPSRSASSPGASETAQSLPPAATDTAAPTAPATDPAAVPDSSVTTTSSGLVQVSLTSSTGLRGAAAHVGTGTQPQIQQDILDLTVRGLGFRAKSAVTVRLGGSASVVVRADTAGSLAVAIDGTQLEGTDPGVSVMAVGRNPAGTEVVLLGSVPPTPGGTGPMSLVPWVAMTAAFGGLAVWMRRPRQAHATAVPRAAGLPDEARSSATPVVIPARLEPTIPDPVPRSAGRHSPG